MADTTALKNRISAAIKANDNQEITGPVLQQALLDIVDELNGATETEASQRQNSDSILQQGINTERERAQSAENNLGQRITNETDRAQEAESTINEKASRALHNINNLEIEDVTGTQSQTTEMSIALRTNEGSEEDPEIVTLDTLIVGQATNQKAGLLPAKSQWGNEPKSEEKKIIGGDAVFKALSENYAKTANSIYSLKKSLGSVANTLLELNNQATHYVFEIEGGDVLHILTSNFCKVAILKSFDFTHSLPYTFDFATGESIRGGSAGGNLINVTTPSDAKYVCLTSQISDGTSTIFTEFTINGINFLTKNGLKDYIDNNIDNKVNTEKTRAVGVEQTLLNSTSLFSTKVDSALFNISYYNYYSGSLDNSGAIVSYNQATYIVIPVTPEESFYIKAGTVAKFAFVKDFEFNHSLPYTLDLCNGTNVTPLASDNERITIVPSDAKYLLLSRNSSDGSGILPIKLNIGDKNYLDCDINDILSNIKSELDELEDSLVELEDSLVETIDIQTSQEIYLYGDDGSKVASSNFNGTGLFDIQDGDVIEYTGSMGSGYHGLLIYSDENTIIGTAFTNGDFSKARYIVNNQNAKYARCQARNSNWGTVPNQLKVSVKSKIATEIENLSERVTVLENQIDIIPNIIIEKVGDGAFDVKIKQQSNGKYLTHRFLRHRYTRLVRYGSSGSATHEEVCSDCWYPSQIYDGTVNLLQGNANFINYVEKENERSYAGEGHGATFSAYAHFFADGVEFNPNTLTGRIECGTFRFVEKNIIYAIDTTQPNFNSDNAIPKFDENGNKEISTIHWLEAKYSVNNIIEFRHRLSIARNNTQFRFCFGAMLELEHELFNHIIINNSEGSENLVSYDNTQSTWVCTPINGSTVALASESTNKGDEIVAYGNNYIVKQKMLQADTSRNNKSSMFPRLYTGSGYRIKFYQQPVITTSNYSAMGQQTETFNEGDMIELNVSREIDLLQ